jgi:hypothetical protein
MYHFLSRRKLLFAVFLDRIDQRFNTVSPKTSVCFAIGCIVQHASLMTNSTFNTANLILKKLKKLTQGHNWKRKIKGHIPHLRIACANRDLHYRCKVTNRCVKELVDIIIVFQILPRQPLAETCRGKIWNTLIKSTSSLTHLLVIYTEIIQDARSNNQEGFTVIHNKTILQV